MVELRETLRIVGQTMRDAQDDWWVIASAAAALHGVEQPDAGDVDVLASDRDVAAVLERLGVTPTPPSAHPLFRSRVLGQWSDAPLMIEFMSGFEYRSEDGWHPMTPKTRSEIVVEGVSVFVPSPTELAAILTAIGRPKDLIRARRLLRR